jgi:hypothetical protein
MSRSVDDLSLSELEELLRAGAGAAKGVGAAPAGSALDALRSEAAGLLVNPDPPQAKALVVKAGKELLKNVDLRSALSADSKAMLEGLTSAAAVALSYADVPRLAAAANQGASSFAAELSIQGQAIAIAALAATGPPGMAAAAVYSTFLGIASAFQAEQEAVRNTRLAEKDAFREACFGAKALQVFLNPAGTGKDGQIVPADIFALQPFPLYSGTCDNGEAVLYRPALGGALIRLLEGGLDEGQTPTTGNDLDELRAFKAAHPGTKIGGSISGVSGTPVTRQYYETLWTGIRAALKDPRLGIPLERRKSFRLLRQAIQAQHKVKGSDGGASLYFAYLDLLNDSFNKGYLPRDPNQLDRILFFHLKTPNSDAPGHKVAELNEKAWAEWGHPSTLAVIISELGRKWELTANPLYAGDIVERERQTRLFNALSQVAAIKDLEARRAALEGRPPSTAPIRVSRAIYDVLPPETREKLNVVLRPSFAGMGDAVRAAQEAARAPKTAITEEESAFPVLPVAAGLALLAGGAWWWSR